MPPSLVQRSKLDYGSHTIPSRRANGQDLNHRTKTKNSPTKAATELDEKRGLGLLLWCTSFLSTLVYLPLYIRVGTLRNRLTMTEPQGPMEEPRVLQLNLETDDEPENNRLQSNNAGRYRPPRPSALPRKSMLKGAAGGHRSRRRSSARFLSIGGRQNPDEDLSHESLGKMYKQAIKMNAENRINASNSWNFKLIENIDKFLTEEPEDAAPQRSISHTPSERQLQEREGTDSSTRGGRRVNFTKASCTLDASVKIYSYRVDDVHLTSYRVLENLHRSDGDKKKKGQDRENSHPVDTEEAPGRSQASNRSRAATSTIETNLGTCA